MPPPDYSLTHTSPTLPPLRYCSVLAIALFAATCALPALAADASAHLAASTRCWLSFGRQELCALRFAAPPTLPSPKRFLSSIKNATEGEAAVLWGHRLLDRVPNPFPVSVAVPKVPGAQVRIAWGFW